MARHYFIKVGDNLPLVGKKRPVWTSIGDHTWSFITDDPEIAAGLQAMVKKGQAGLAEVTQAELAEKKSSSSSRQSEIDRRRQREESFMSPGSKRQGQRQAFQESEQERANQIQSHQSQLLGRSDVVARPPRGGTIEQEPSVDAFAEKARSTPKVDQDRPEASRVSDLQDSSTAVVPEATEKPPF